jgi:hypothetical protein
MMVETTGIEPSDKAKAIAIKSNFFVQSTKDWRCSFDVVSMWHVLACSRFRVPDKRIETIIKTIRYFDCRGSKFQILMQNIMELLGSL